MHKNSGFQNAVTATKVLWASSKGKQSFKISILVIFITHAALIVLQEIFPNTWLYGEIALFPISILLTAFTYQNFQDSEPLIQLVCSPGAKEAPFILAAAAAISERHLHDEEWRKAIDELTDQLKHLKAEDEYIPEMCQHVKGGAVWAVCGRKSDLASQQLYGACDVAFGSRQHVERIFLPPKNAGDYEPVKKAIVNHLKSNMVVRAIRAEAIGAAREASLPSGFGMTLVGRQERFEADAPCTPKDVHCVLVHWGSTIDGSSSHRGIILKHPLWTAHFVELFGAIAAWTEAVNRDSDGKKIEITFEKFIAAYPHYGRKPSGFGTTFALSDAAAVVGSEQPLADQYRPTAIHHVSLHVYDLAEAALFFTQELGLVEHPNRPKFTFEAEPLGGRWFQLPSGQHVHLVEMSDDVKCSAGRIDFRFAHFALCVPDAEEIERRLKKCGYTTDRNAAKFTGSPQIYVVGPEGHLIEFNQLAADLHQG